MIGVLLKVVKTLIMLLGSVVSPVILVTLKSKYLIRPDIRVEFYRHIITLTRYLSSLMILAVEK